MSISNSRRRWSAAGAAVPLLACLACGSCRSRTVAAVEDATLRIGFGIGSSAKETSLSALTDVLYAEPLLTRGWDGRPMPRLAEAWQWEDAGRTLRLRLKPGVQFHDNTPFGAAEAATLLSTFIADPDRRPWGFEHVTSVSAVDPHTVVLRLSQPDIFLLSGLADRKMVRPESPDIGTGPFRLFSRDPMVEARRFDKYHGGASDLAAVRIVTFDTTRSVWSALMRGEIDAAQEVNRDAVEFMEHSANVQTYQALQPFYVSMVFNHRHPILRNVDVRRALTEALDKRAIIERAMRQHGREADTPFWPMHWAYAPPPDRYRYDQENAKRRLDNAGLTLPGQSQPGQVRSRFRFTCMVYEDPQYERIALMVQRQLLDIGVDMVIELVGMDAFEPRAASGNFDAFLMRANAGRSLDFTYRFWRSATSGQKSLQNSGYTGSDALFERLRRSTTDEEVRATVAALVEKFHEDAPAAFIAWLEVTRAVDSRFSVGGSTGEDPLTNIGQWRPKDRPPVP